MSLSINRIGCCSYRALALSETIEDLSDAGFRLFVMVALKVRTDPTKLLPGDYGDFKSEETSVILSLLFTGVTTALFFLGT